MSRIAFLNARTIADSRGDLTIEVIVELESGARAIASVPQGKSRGRAEAFLLETAKAVENVNQLIASAIQGKDFKNQQALDKFLIALDGTSNKSKLGANACLGVSLAFARASAISRGIPLWQYIRGLVTDKSNMTNGSDRTDRTYKTPRLLVNIIGGGLHAKNNLDFQEYLIIPKTSNVKEAFETAEVIYENVNNHLKSKFGSVLFADEGNFAPNLADNEEPFLIIKEAARAANLSDKIDFGLDAAASNVRMKSNELFNWYYDMKKKYNLLYLEDPFSEEDFENFSELLDKIGDNTIIAGDDLTVTNLQRMERAREQKSINGVIIKPNQIGTLTETIEAVKKAKELGWAVIVSHRSGETNDSFIADLAYGVGADGLKAGAPLAPGRSVKYKRLINLVSGPKNGFTENNEQ
jgi:enolase